MRPDDELLEAPLAGEHRALARVISKIEYRGSGQSSNCAAIVFRSTSLVPS